MARTATKVKDLLREDPEMEAALAYLLDRDPPIEWKMVSGELTSGQWGRLIEKGILVEDGDGFELANRDAVRDIVEDDDVDQADGEDEEDSSWSKYDKLAALGALALFTGYWQPSILNMLGSTFDLLLFPLDELLPFYVAMLILALFTGLYSTLLQSNLMDMEIMGDHQERMKDIQERRKAAKERGDDEALERIQKEQMDAMGDQMGMFKAQFRPMVWIMLFTIPVFLWMYWKVRGSGTISPAEMEIVLPLAGTVEWEEGILGPIQAWIVWYFLCSMGFTQIIRKSLNIQTTPT